MYQLCPPICLTNQQLAFPNLPSRWFKWLTAAVNILRCFPDISVLLCNEGEEKLIGRSPTVLSALNSYLVMGLKRASYTHSFNKQYVL